MRDDKQVPEIEDDTDETDAELAFEDENPEDNDPDPDAEAIVDLPFEGDDEPGEGEEDGDPEDREADPEADDATSSDLPPDMNAVESDIQPGISFVALGDVVLEYRHWRNPRSVTGLDEVKLQFLSDSILSRTTSAGGALYAGIADPLKIVPIRANGGAVLLVIDGQRRVMAAERAKLPPDALIPVRYLEPEPIEWTPREATRFLALALNDVGTREGLSSYELAENAHRLRESVDPDTGKDYTLAAIAVVVGRSDSWCSKMLKAWDSAAPKLLLQWRKAEITDEQFKDLAAQRDQAAQERAAEEVSAARKSGDKAASRTIAKETKAIARAAAKPVKYDPGRHLSPAATKTSGKAPAKAPAKDGKGKQPEPPITKGADKAKPKEETRKPPSMAVVDDLIFTAGKVPPTHDYVKGMIAGVQWARGLMDQEELAKPWRTWLDRASAKARK